jgi:hypothetical protein
MAKWANTPTRPFRLWLDCDGVAADFDAGFQTAFGLSSEAYEQLHGTKAFWKAIRDELNFFGTLPLMPDAMELYNAVKPVRPIFLTGCPFGNWAEHQKFGWRNKHFPGTPMVTCLSRNKREYCQPGDILVDDITKYKHLWEEAGGTFILHTSAASSIAQLKLLGVI